MNYLIDKSSPEPAYLQLYRLFVRDIAAGIYPYGSRLPSKRTIADETGVSVITAEHAVGLLCEEGYAESRQRSGTFVIFRGEDFPGGDSAGDSGRKNVVRDGSLRSSDRSVFAQDDPGQSDFARYDSLRSDEENDKRNGKKGGEKDDIKKDDIKKDDVKNDKRNGRQRDSQQRVSGDSGEFPFSVLAKTMRRVLQDYGERILVKSPNHGCLELRSAICLYLGRSKGLVVDPSQVIVGSGAEYLYGLIVQLLGTDRIYALENPSYRKIQEVYEAMGASCDLLTLGPDGIATGELERTKAQILHVTPFNSYPSGITAGISKKHEYLRWAKRRGGILIEDNYDSELTVSRKAEEPLYSMDADADVIYLNTFSRTVAPSMRVGYMILPARMLDDFDRKLGFYSCTVPIFDQYVLAELLQSGDFERHINRVRREKRKQLSSGQFFPR